MSELPSTDHETGALGRAVERLATALAILGGLALLAITVLTCLSIAGRAALTLGLGFGPVPGDFELVEVASGLAVFFFLPYCQLKRGHVTVDIFSNAFGRRGVAISDVVGNGLMTGAAALILWRLFAGFQDKLRSGEESFILALPSWWGYAIALVGAAAFVLVSAYTLWRAIHELRSASEVSPSPLV